MAKTERRTEKDLTGLFYDLVYSTDYSDLFTDYLFSINNRFTRSLGLCTTYEDDWDSPINTIEVSKVLLSCNEKFATNIILHEMAHVIAYGECHNKKFYDVLVEIGGMTKEEEHKMLLAERY